MSAVTEIKPILEVTESLVLTDEAEQLIEHTLWGTEGALYRVKNYPETLRAIPGLKYLFLKKEGRLIALRMLVPKKIYCGSRPVDALYHSLFIVDPSERAKGYGKELARATLEYSGTHLKRRGLVYAYTEAGNLNSAHIKSSQGYLPLGQFHTTAFSRFFPKASPRMEPLRPDQKRILIDKLRNQYAGHGLTDFETSVRTDHTFVLSEGADLMASVQVELKHWQIQSLEGVGGIIALRALPHIPLMRDLFNPAAFRFLHIGNIYFKTGRAAAAHELIESVLARHQLKTAMAYLDKKSPVYHALAQAGSFGVVNALTETPVNVTGYFIGFTPEEISDLQSRPLSISPLDV